MPEDDYQEKYNQMTGENGEAVSEQRTTDDEEFQDLQSRYAQMCEERDIPVNGAPQNTQQAQQKRGGGGSQQKELIEGQSIVEDNIYIIVDWENKKVKRAREDKDEALKFYEETGKKFDVIEITVK